MAKQPPLTYGQVRDQLARANLVQNDLLSTVAKRSLFGGTYAVSLVDGQLILTKYTTRVLTGLAKRYSKESFTVPPALNPQGTRLSFQVAGGKVENYTVNQASLPLLQAILERF